MKPISFLFLILTATFSANAQFEIETFSQIDIDGDTNDFPIIRSKKNADAARRVNEVLHLEMLEKVFLEDDVNRFGEVFPTEEEFWGATEFEYEVIANNKHFFSVGITCVYTGAYSEYYTSYFNFDAKSGQQIVLSDIFAETPLWDLGTWVNDQIATEIEEFISGLDVSDDYQSEQYVMFSECLEWISEDVNFSTRSFYMTDTSMVFTRERCSNHAMAVLDDLWDFYVPYPMDQMIPLMNDNGNAMMSNEALEFGQNGVAEYKILEGSIAGKYPITVIIHRSYESTFSGYYWYNSVREPIRLNGTVNEETGALSLTEEVNETVTGYMELEISGEGGLEGTWTNATEEKNLPIVLKVGK